MKHSHSVLFVSLAVALAACSPQGSDKKEESAAAIVPTKTDAPAGAYTLDKSHASLIFRVSHLGFSHYTARFGSFDSQLNFDPANPGASTVEATIDPASLEVGNPPPGFLDELKGPHWLDAAQFPAITFHSTAVTLTGANTAHVVGDFSLHGVTHPVTLDATFNGGYAGHPMDPHGRIGFSAHGTFKRSDFGIAFGVPAPGTTMGVGDEVEVLIEAEFSGPPLANMPAAAAPPGAPAPAGEPPPQ